MGKRGWLGRERGMREKERDEREGVVRDRECDEKEREIGRGREDERETDGRGERLVR